MLRARFERRDDRVVELGANQIELVPAIEQREAERAAHHARAEDCDACHQPPPDDAGLVCALLALVLTGFGAGVVACGAAVAAGGVVVNGGSTGRPRFENWGKPAASAG